jgi:predicted O-methyltransferase YrrM
VKAKWCNQAPFSKTHTHSQKMAHQWDVYESLCSGESMQKYNIDNNDEIDEINSLKLVRSYPDVFQQILNFAVGANFAVMRFDMDSSWERSVVHNLAHLVGLKHYNSKTAVEVSKPENFELAKRKEFALFPKVKWDADIRTNSPLEMNFSDAILNFPDLHAGVIRFASSGLKSVVFTAALSLEEQAAVFSIARHFEFGVSLFAFPDNLEFLELSRCKKSKSSVEEQVESYLDSKFSLDVEVDLEVSDKAGINPFTGKFIMWVVKEKKVCKSLEIGLANAVSTCFFLEAYKSLGFKGSHTAIDPFQRSEWKSKGLERLHSLKAEDYINFRFIEEESEFALPRLCKSSSIDTSSEHGTFDVVLIDGNHRFDHAFIDVFYSSRLLREGGFLILDDSDMPSIKKVICYIITNYPHFKPYPRGCFRRSFSFIKIAESDQLPWFVHTTF